MKRKGFLVVLVLILAILLSGCGGVIPGTDEAKIKSVIHEYFLAISNQNWSKAKSCCVYGSERYYATCQGESLINSLYLYCNIVTINTYADILSVSTYGNYSDVYLHLTALITACGYYESDSSYGYYYLQKVGNSWKIYAP
ncbi:hypothetical protein ES695_01410 [Candidatus Atribacteria bacterium 1244-E10-H5-B2]|nr:MAG: hypothetical protein ES695_01410 [Candidatus Atribacteria bacterium 1244-E10-H5-B2]